MQRFFLSFAIAIVAASSVHAADPIGERPASVRKPLSDVPNAQAIVARLWAPGIDEGYVPQGIAFARGKIALSAYRSTDPKQDRGPCRLFIIVPETAEVTETIDLPGTCGHAGGVAALADGRWVVADTRQLYVVENGKVTASAVLNGKLRGSFVDFDGTDLWTGFYDRNTGTLWRLPLDRLTRGTLSEADATATLTVPSRAQGLGFDRKGSAWLSVSGANDGKLIKINPADGKVIASYAMPAGIEDLGVDDQGLIWTVSEAGSIRWSNWTTTFPVIFAIDPAKLKAEP